MCCSHVEAEQESVGKLSADLEHQTQGVSGMRPQHLAVRK